MAISTKESGKMLKKMAKESCKRLMAINVKENGRKGK